MYKDVWGAAEGEVLPCAREGNIQDPFAVAVKKRAPQQLGMYPGKCLLFVPCF